MFLNRTDTLEPPAENPFAGDVVFPGEVSFTNLQPNHSAVYQCEASNVHGTILATANVDVIGECPRAGPPLAVARGAGSRPHSAAL